MNINIFWFASIKFQTKKGMKQLSFIKHYFTTGLSKHWHSHMVIWYTSKFSLNFEQKNKQTTKKKLYKNQYIVLPWNKMIYFLTLWGIFCLCAGWRRVQSPVQVVSKGLLVLSMNEFKHILMHHIRLGDRGTNEEGQCERNIVERM